MERSWVDRPGRTLAFSVADDGPARPLVTLVLVTTQRRADLREAGRRSERCGAVYLTASLPFYLSDTNRTTGGLIFCMCSEAAARPVASRPRK
jgi:hypothetical protein